MLKNIFILLVVLSSTTSLRSFEEESKYIVRSSFKAPCKLCMGLAYDGEKFWTFDKKTDELISFSKFDGSIIRKFKFETSYGIGLSYSKKDGLLYLTDVKEKRLYLIDPKKEEAVIKIDIDLDLPSGIQISRDDMWIADSAFNGTVYRFDRNTLEVLDVFPAGGKNPFGMAVDKSCLWIANNIISNAGAATINCLDRETGKLKRSFRFIEGKKGFNGLEVVDDNLYIISNKTDKIFKVEIL